MNIYDLADALHKTLILMRYPHQNGRYAVHFEYCETKDDSSSHALCGTYGDGPTPLAALNDYARRLSGRLLVFHAGSQGLQQEFGCPQLSALENA